MNFFIVILLIGTSITHCVAQISQEKKAYNFLVDPANYQYLDNDLVITIDSEKFQQTIKKFGYKAPRHYSDSVSIALMAQYENWDSLSIHSNKVTYTWNRLAYHLWLSEDQTKALAARYGYFKLPWNFKMHLIESKNHDAFLINFFNNLEHKVIDSEFYKNNTIKYNNIDDLLNIALVCNPRRIQDFIQLKEDINQNGLNYLERHGEINDDLIGIGCEKENCCQKHGKNK